MIEISKEHIEEIKAHAQKDYPHECCGIILGKFNQGEKSVKQIISISNEKDEKYRHNRYLITSNDILKTEIYAQKQGLDIVGFYHSHPDCSANPSDFDKDHALPVYSYFIVSVINGVAKDFTVSQLLDDRSKFVLEKISTRTTRCSL
jgi:proteasome lid subunit RPN8/RPN11